MLTTSPAGSSRGRLSSLAVNGCWEGGKHGLGGRWREMAWCWGAETFFFSRKRRRERLGQKNKGGHSSSQAGVGSTIPSTGHLRPRGTRGTQALSRPSFSGASSNNKARGTIQGVGRSVVCMLMDSSPLLSVLIAISLDTTSLSWHQKHSPSPSPPFHPDSQGTSQRRMPFPMYAAPPTPRVERRHPFFGPPVPE